MFHRLFATATPVVLLCLAALTAWAQGSSSWVDVGPGHADAGAATDAPFGFARSESRVGHVNLGRGLAVGFGPNGLTLSHSIGLQDHGLGLGHNFNLSVGPNGTHVGHGGVVTVGPNSQVFTGGNSRIDRFGPRGGSYAGGHGHFTRAWSRNRTWRR